MAGRHAHDGARGDEAQRARQEAADAAMLRVQDLAPSAGACAAASPPPARH